MTDLFVIENKISAAEKYLKILEDFEKYSRAELEKNLLIKGAVERYLYYAIINYDVVYDVLHKGLKDIRFFLNKIRGLSK